MGPLNIYKHYSVHFISHVLCLSAGGLVSSSSNPTQTFCSLNLRKITGKFSEDQLYKRRMERLSETPTPSSLLSVFPLLPSMASFLKPPFFFGFLLLLLASSAHVHARLGSFFRLNDGLSPPEIAPSVAPSPFSSPASPPELVLSFAPEPEPSFYESQDAYGLYGHRSTEFSPEKQTKTTTDNGEDNYDAKGDYPPGESSFESGYENTNLYGLNYENSETYNNGGYKNTYEKNESEIESEGMSDSRFTENGNYLYNGGSDNQNGEYSGYRSSESTEMQSFNGGNEYPNEYNSMEEYESQEDRSNQEYGP